MNIISDILANITALINKNDITVIGIDGLGGSGKSMISDMLSETLFSKGYNNIIFHLDDFIFPRSVRYDEQHSQWQCYYSIQWRYDYFINKVLLPIKKNQTFDDYIELYDKENDNYKKQKLEIQNRTIIIVEGIFLQRKELKDLFDYVIYIDVPESERLERLVKRDTYIGSDLEIVSKYQNRYFPAEHKYIAEYSPKHLADCVIYNTQKSAQ